MGKPKANRGDRIESAQRGHSRESGEAANRSGEWPVAEYHRKAARLASTAKAVW
jgi:hypothetical protein